MAKEICLTARTVQRQERKTPRTVIQQTGRDRTTTARLANKWGWAAAVVR